MKKLLLLLALAATGAVAYAQGFSNNKIKVGQKAPELAYENPAGQVIRLSEINKGRVVLIDFWASWCRPCRMANPALVRMYKEYKDKKFLNAPNGFTVLSVSLDQNPGMWRLALQADSLNWEYHMADTKNSGQGPSRAYGVEYIPQAFLVGPDGKIRGKYMTAEEALPALQALVAE